MNFIRVNFCLIYETFVKPKLSTIFTPPKPNQETGGDNPTGNTAEIPNADAGNRSNPVIDIHHAIDIPEIESNGGQSATTAASSESATAQDSQPTANAAPLDENQLKKWLYFMVTTYLTTIDISLQALQTMKNAPELSRSSQFHYFRMFLVISLVYLTVSAFVRLLSVPVALAMLHVAVLFGFLAFILVITIPDFPTEVIKVSSATFIVPLSIIFLATYLRGR